MDYTTLPRKILNPRWLNVEKTHVMCEFSYEGGPVVTAAVMDTEEGNSDWKEIMSSFTQEEIDKNTTDFIANDQKKKSENEKLEKQRREEHHQTMKNEALFAAKLEAFEIEEVKNSKNRKLKTAIRKAQSIIEVNAYTTILLMNELNANTKAE